MDGFAVRAADTPGTLPVGFRIAAGRPVPRPLEAGEAMEISTGGGDPDGADAVNPVEHAVAKENAIETPEAVPQGANWRPPGGGPPAGAQGAPPGGRLRGPR